MGCFPEDHKIWGSKLVRMWMAEGFVKANGNKSLEEEAEGCLKALVDRNLIFVSEYKYAKPILYGMHDLMRDQCIRKCNEDKFVYVGNGRVSNARRMFLAGVYDITQECIFIIGGIRIEFKMLRLVRVLDVRDWRFNKFPMVILQLVNLCFSAVQFRSGIVRGISRLKNLHTFIVYVYPCCITSEIFEMSELRHLGGATIKIVEEKMKIAPNKLQTVSSIIITKSLIRRGFLESIPDIKTLSLDCEHDSYLTPGALDLTHLHKLETLTISHGGRDRPSTFKFPSGLRELVVYYHMMTPSAMTTLCALPNLEVLKMEYCEFAREGDDEEWEVAEGDEFLSLQVLHLDRSQLVRWIADETNFPRLCHLYLYSCGRLQEIPSGIGEIPTLQSIELQYCTDSVVASARRIVEEQHDNGNYSLQLRIE